MKITMLSNPTLVPRGELANVKYQIMAKQSTKDRELRLSEGRCPIHGGWMSQLEPWHESDGFSFTVVGCSRRDCDIRAKAYSIDGPWELMPEFEYLLQQNEDGFAKLYEFTK